MSTSRVVLSRHLGPRWPGFVILAMSLLLCLPRAITGAGSIRLVWLLVVVICFAIAQRFQRVGRAVADDRMLCVWTVLKVRRFKLRDISAVEVRPRTIGFAGFSREAIVVIVAGDSVMLDDLNGPVGDSRLRDFCNAVDSYVQVAQRQA